MKNLIDFYDYSVPFTMLYHYVIDELHHDFDPHEYTEFGIQVCDTREFELICDLCGCLDANL